MDIKTQAYKMFSRRDKCCENSKTEHSGVASWRLSPELRSNGQKELAICLPGGREIQGEIPGRGHRCKEPCSIRSQWLTLKERVCPVICWAMLSNQLWGRSHDQSICQFPWCKVCCSPVSSYQHEVREPRAGKGRAHLTHGVSRLLPTTV